MSPTVAEKAARTGTFTSGFDYMRIVLAFAVVATHGYALTHPENRIWMWSSATRLLTAPVLPMFFALSGFLVTGSLLKSSTISTFVTHRALRLLPALGVEVLLSALLLGPLVTSWPLTDYFRSPVFWHYFANMAGWIHFELPGVFVGPESIAQPGIVNRSLWTIPFELECYVALVALTLVKFVRKPAWFLAIVLAFVGWGSWGVIANAGLDLHVPATPVDGRALVGAFLAGCCLKLWEDKIRLSWAAFAVSVVVSCAALLRYYQTQYLALFPVAYATVFLGMLNPPRNRVILSGDYSYGVYLFAFPLQQTYFLLFPGSHNYAAHLAFSAICATLYAQFSWRCIEKPVLARRKTITVKVDALISGLKCRIPFAVRVKALSASQATE